MEKVACSRIITPDGASIMVYEITKDSKEMLLELGDTELYLDEYEKIATEKRKCEFVAVRLALKGLIGGRHLIKYDADGKPFLEDNSFQISISHAAKWVAVMLHSKCLVGIDIEIPTDKIQRIYTRFLSVAEQAELSNGENLKQLQLAWSAKEALYKIIGNEAVDFASQLHIFSFEVKNTGQIKALHLPSNCNYELSYIQTPNYHLVYCIA